MLVSLTDNSKCEVFVNIFQHLKLFSVNINLYFKEEKLYIQGMDSSHVSIFELNIEKSWFDVYEITEDSVIGVNSTILFRIMNTRTFGQVISIHNENDSLELDLINKEENKEDFNKYFKIPMMDVDEDMMEIPETDYDVDMTMSSKKFKSLVDQLSNFSDTLDIIYSDEKIYLNSESIEEGCMKIEIKLDDLEGCEVTEDVSLSLSFATRYIQNMTQFLKISKDVQIEVMNDTPLRITYKICDNNYIRFFLAPKIKDD